MLGSAIPKKKKKEEGGEIMQIYDFMTQCYHSRGRRKFVQIHGFMPLLTQGHKARVQADKEN